MQIKSSNDESYLTIVEIKTIMFLDLVWPPSVPEFAGKFLVVDEGRSSLVVKVMDLELACHELKPSTTENPLCSRAMYIKSVKSSNVLPLVWIYGDKTEELIKGLKRNPFLALPIVLKRMKLKEDEWKEHQKKFNVIWKNQINKNYLKSLDHQGIQFEQNDFKSFHPENLLNEIEMIYAENKNKQTNSKTHFILEFKEAEVFLDVINLMLQHLKKLPEVSRDDRHKIELVVRSFIPDIFCAPRSTKIDNALEIDEENKGEPIDVDNDSGERSGQHSSVGSSKDEGEVFSEVDSNEDYFSGESFIPKMNVFDKMDPLPVTNLPYTLFFVSKTWFVFFRQFHILFERLSKLLHESNYKEELLKRKGFIWIQEEETPKSSYKELIDGLNQLMSGAIDYSQFEEMARSHFGIHAYVSFTMDKLIHAIVGQLQQVVMDDLSKECTAIFIQHSKKISTSGCASPLKASQLEYKYLQRVEKMMDDEKFFKIIWHKKDCVLTIELLEYTFVTDDDCCEEFLTQVQQSPVFLPRNLRKQMLLWKNRVVQVEKQWQQKESTKYLKKHPPLSARKKRALSAISPLFSKKQRPSSIPEGSLHPPCSGMVPNNGNEPNNFDNSVSIKKKPVEEIFENYEELGSEENLNKTVVCVENQVDIKRKEDMEEPNIVIDPEKMVNCPINESVVIDAVAFSALNIRSEKLSPNSLSEIEDQDLKETFIKMTIKEKITDQALKETFVNVTIKEETSNEEVEKMEVDEKNSCTSVVSSVGEYVSVVEPGNASKDNISGKKTEDSMLRAIFLGSTDSNIDLISKIGTVIEVAHNTVGTIKTEESDFQTGDAKGKKQLKRKTTQKTYGCSTKRRKRTNRSYVKRKMKRGSPRSMLGNQRRQEKYKFEALDDPTFDFKYFSELPEIDKVSYLALKDVIIQDDEEVSFKIGSYKMHFVQNRELFLHRKDSLTRAQEIHQSVSEIKASNFNAWHRLWLYRYVTPSMFKYCNDWLLRSDPKKFKLMRVTLNGRNLAYFSTNNPKQNSKEKTKRSNNDNAKDNPKRAGPEDFKTPTKIARKIIEVPIEKVVCTSKNKSAVLEDEEGMEVSPSTPTPKIKPIMMKINKNYNLILQEIYRSYPNTVNKNTGNYIKIQPATAEDQDKIKNLLIIKKADHYTIEHPTVIKAVIKGFPSSTNVTNIETEKQKDSKSKRLRSCVNLRQNPPYRFL
ncbi:paired amphipathic helix protein Sin3a [Trichonephila clavipes]|nr:paired amphipathic helix protein Sin3a [Trichonephila clavipes]